MIIIVARSQTALQVLRHAKIVLHIQSNPNRQALLHTLAQKVDRTVMVNFTLKIEMGPQQQLRVWGVGWGGEKRLPELATFWRSKRRKIGVLKALS